jgi:hypothetical protein
MSGKVHFVDQRRAQTSSLTALTLFSHNARPPVLLPCVRRPISSHTISSHTISSHMSTCPSRDRAALVRCTSQSTPVIDEQTF